MVSDNDLEIYSAHHKGNLLLLKYLLEILQTKSIKI